jgi:hypothetical protein
MFPPENDDVRDSPARIIYHMALQKATTFSQFPEKILGYGHIVLAQTCTTGSFGCYSGENALKWT